MKNDVVIDGVKYRAVKNGNIKIVVLERGFVYVGYVEETDTKIIITNARCLIRWGTKNHLGELAEGPSENTKLGDPCIVMARLEQVIHTIEVNQDEWKKHFD